eukprot:3095670-Pleurochrysis_carterae.AAC.4
MIKFSSNPSPSPPQPPAHASHVLSCTTPATACVCASADIVVAAAHRCAACAANSTGGAQPSAAAAAHRQWRRRSESCRACTCAPPLCPAFLLPIPHGMAS